MNDALLTVSKLTKEYRNGAAPVRVLNGVDLAMPAGAIMTIVGASGAGKSTLLHIIGALDRPSSGTVAYAGDDVYRMTDTERAHIRNAHFGFVFQFYHLMPELTAFENVLLPSMVARKADAGARAWAAELLTAVGLRERATHYPNQLSGGEQQRVAIARALMNKPRIVFADEPTGNLDRSTSDGVLRLLLTLQRQHGYALLIVTHDPDIAQYGAQRLRLSDGVVQSQAQPGTMQS